MKASEPALLRAVLIDDEPAATRSLSKLLELFCPHVKVEASAENVPEGVRAIEAHQPDVVFLDIEMPGYSGFELLQFFKQVSFEIVFVTAYEAFAVKAFEVSAVDYLLKPVQPEALQSAVDKVREKRQQQHIQARLTALEDNLQSRELQKLGLPMSDGLVFVATQDILYLEADGSYTHVRTQDGQTHLVSKPLKFFADALNDHSDFFRSHRSFLVNLRHCQTLKRGSRVLQLEDGSTLPIARNQRKALEAALERVHLV